MSWIFWITRLWLVTVISSRASIKKCAIRGFPGLYFVVVAVIGMCCMIAFMDLHFVLVTMVAMILIKDVSTLLMLIKGCWEKQTNKHNLDCNQSNKCNERKCKIDEWIRNHQLLLFLTWPVWLPTWLLCYLLLPWLEAKETSLLSTNVIPTGV